MLKFVSSSGTPPPRCGSPLVGERLAQQRKRSKSPAEPKLIVMTADMELTVTELREMAQRQQRQIQEQERILHAREQQLKSLRQQRKERVDSEVDLQRLREMQDKVNSQQVQLRKFRALKAQVEQQKSTNEQLGNELDKMKTLFAVKEKEVASAVNRVNQLTQELENIRRRRESQQMLSANADAQMKRVKKELVNGTQTEHEKKLSVEGKKRLIVQKKKQIALLDEKLNEVRDRLKRQEELKQQGKPQNIQVAAVEPYRKYGAAGSSTNVPSTGATSTNQSSTASARITNGLLPNSLHTQPQQPKSYTATFSIDGNHHTNGPIYTTAQVSGVSRSKELKPSFTPSTPPSSQTAKSTPTSVQQIQQSVVELKINGLPSSPPKETEKQTEPKLSPPVSKPEPPTKLQVATTGDSNAVNILVGRKGGLAPLSSPEQSPTFSDDIQVHPSPIRLPLTPASDLSGAVSPDTERGRYKASVSKLPRRRVSSQESLNSIDDEARSPLPPGDQRAAFANSSSPKPTDAPPLPITPPPALKVKPKPLSPNLSPGGTTTGSKKPLAILRRESQREERRARAQLMQRRVSFDPLALLLDASLEGELELVKKTAKQVPDASAANDEGITALHNAICAGHEEIVKFLVEFGCDINSQDTDGWTPLHCSASCNNVDMSKFLVEHGACIFATTVSDQETPADKCEEDEIGFDECFKYLFAVQEKLGELNDTEVYALFDYAAQNNDELSFACNERLTVVRKGDSQETDWWWASNANGEQGYVPRNMLGLHPRVIPDDMLLSPPPIAKAPAEQQSTTTTTTTASTTTATTTTSSTAAITT